jgi:hypothetical protein
MHVFAVYLAVTGGLSAGMQVSRGLVRAAERLFEGEPRAALAEAVGGVLAPAQRVVGEAICLGLDAWAAAQALTGSGEAGTFGAESHLRAAGRAHAFAGDGALS